MADPWDIPPAPRFGDATVCEVALAKNRALNTWEAMEDDLAALNARFDPSGREYGTGPTFTGRITILEKAASAYFAKHPSQGDFSRITCHLRKMAARRNDIAHGIVIPYTTFPVDDISQLPSPSRFALCPPKYDVKRQKFAYNAAQIEAFSAGFSFLRYEIQEFTSLLP